MVVKLDLAASGRRRWSLFLAGAVMALAMAALAGWGMSVQALAAVRPGYIPMAVNTALGFLLLNAALGGLWLARPVPGAQAQSV